MATAPPSSREKILDVAESLFAQRGLNGVGLREVADAVGLSKSSLFHHFRGKSELYFEVLARALERIRERSADLSARSAGPAEQLDRTLDALVDVLAEQPTTARLLLRALFEDEDSTGEPSPGQARVEALLEQILGELQGVLRAGVASGAFRPLSVPQVVQTLIGATAYHFASGEFGESLLGRSLFSAEAVAGRREELRRLVRHGIAAD